jgi:hypothetical protein
VLWPLLVGVSATACDGCGKEKPYTPFGVASGEPLASAPLVQGSSEPRDAGSTRPGFVAKPATIAPRGATRWSLGDRRLEAPAGRAFERGLAADFDADDKPEVVAWTVPAGGAPGALTVPGELWLYPADGPARKLFELPGFVPSGPACTHTPSLWQTGPRSVTLDVSAKCTATLLPRAPTRAISVIAPLATRTEVLTVRSSEAAPGETLEVRVDSSDRDGDGRDDVRMNVSVAAGTERPAALDLVWLDRAAGTSRDTTEPKTSLERMAAGELWRSKNKKQSGAVRASVGAVRRLMATACAEGGVARISERDGAPLSCGPLGNVIDRLLTAETQAALADGDVLGAFAAAGRDGWYFGKASDKTRKDLEKRLLDAVSSIDAPRPLPVSVALAPAPATPHFGRIAFDSDGALWAQAQTGLVRIDPTGRVDSAAEAGASWPLEIVRPDGERLLGLIAGCDDNVVSLGFERSAEKTALLAPRPGSCAGGRPTSLVLAPLAVGDSGVEGLIDGEHVGPRASTAAAVLRPPPRGTPRSPDGKWLASPTPLGVLVVGGDRPLLFRSLPAGLGECTSANRAERIACVEQGAVRIWLKP